MPRRSRPGLAASGLSGQFDDLLELHFLKTIINGMGMLECYTEIKQK